MAQRIAPLSTPVASPRSRETRRRLASLTERERARFTADPRLFIWQACWSPIWLGSNGPAPRPWQRVQREGTPRRVALAGKVTGAGGFIQSNLDRLAFRLWLSLLAGSVLRGLWLALLIATGWVLLALIGFIALPPVIAIVTLVGLGAITGAAYGVLHRIEASTVAVMMDRTFGLDERLTTANGHQPGGSESGGPVLPRLQLADAANALGEVLHELPRAVFVPVREAIALLVVAMALLTGLFAYVPDRPLPGLADAPVPRFVPASERLANPQTGDRPLATTPEQPASSSSDVQQQAQTAQQAREDLGVLGEALQDHPITQAASDAIAAGDYGAASEMIRSAASQAPNASDQERGALADDLDAAADQVSATNPDLADASREAADDLRQGGTQSEEGLEGLADTVDQTAGAVEQDDQLAQESGPTGQESQSGERGSSGGVQPGVTGQESESGGDGQQEQESGTDQSSSSASGQSQQPAGETGDPGEGVAAEPGVANEEMQEPNTSGEEAGEMSGAGSSGQSQSGAGGAPDPEATDGAPGSDRTGQQPPAGEGGSSEGGDPASGAGSQGLIGAPDDETSASQGSGAGTGQSGANDQTRGDQEVGDPAAPGEGEAAAPPAVGVAGDPPPGNGGGDGSAGEIGEVSGGTNDLSLQGTSDEGVRTGGTSGSSSTGSGAGSGAASGDQVQQQVGVAGPDANRIPDGMQDVVEDFFTDPGTGP
ncbi:MAG: hypothetical protein M3440_05370 [Chloroflexota bacterium]|nr:hypothetical protein [Chloroflexota bacterium]